MKRTCGVSVAAAALILVAATAWAGDEPSSTPASPDPAAPPATTTMVKPAHHMKTAGKTGRHSMTDLNSASRESLLKLPGITDPIADKIIGARPFKSRDELLSKSIVTKDEFTKIRWRVTARPSAMSAAAK